MKCSMSHLLACFVVVVGLDTMVAQEPPTAEPTATTPPERLVKLSKDDDIWIDLQRKLVVVDGQVAMREGQLEMLVCPKGTKEHESLVAVNSKSQLVHAGLLAVGAIAGHPVRFHPEYVPATGSIIDIFFLWEDEEGKHKVRAQQWVKDSKTGKEMQDNWVFGGSGFWTDERTGEKFYHADGGDLICLSNFSTATLDVPVESSQSNESLVFSAFTERVPPRGTKVRVVLIPRPDKKPNAAKPDPTKPPAASATPASADKLGGDQQADKP